MENVDRGVYLSYNRIMSEKTTNNKIIRYVNFVLIVILRLNKKEKNKKTEKTPQYILGL